MFRKRSIFGVDLAWYEISPVREIFTIGGRGVEANYALERMLEMTKLTMANARTHTTRPMMP